MTNSGKYREYLKALQQIYSLNEAAVITDWVFRKVADLQRADLVKNPNHPLNDAVLDQLNQKLAELLQHKPVQYVLGEVWFYKMKLVVNEHVLIPRPETEELVQLVIEDCRSKQGGDKLKAIKEPLRPIQNFSILDIGTGSGCIAIAIKKNLPDTRMHAIEISTEALNVAKENAISQQAEIEFLQADFLDESNWKDFPVFDLIISNPPYIPLNEKEKLDKNVTAFEPHIALFVPENAALIFYEKIAGFGKKHLSDIGKIYVEIHEDFAKEATEIFEPFYLVEIKKDIFGKERMLIATKALTQL